jgi:hypothetical protein
MNAKVIEGLKQMGACPDALAWVMTHKSAKSAWLDCDRADRMMWVLGKTVKLNSAAHKKLVLLTCRIASDAQRYSPKPIPAAARAIRLARAWTRGKATLDEVTAAARVAEPGLAAGAARWSAAATWDAGTARWGCAWAATAAAAAAKATGTGTVWDAKLKLYAKWVRASFPNPPRLLRGDACTK